MKSRRVIRYASLVALCVTVVFLFSCGKLKKLAGVGDFKVDVENGAVEASVVLTKESIDTGMTVGIPQLKDSFIMIEPNPGSKGIRVSLLAPIRSIAETVGAKYLQVKSLPDGRFLAGTTEGALPSFDMTAGKFAMRFYVSGDVFGIFIPVKLPNFSSSAMEVPVKNSRGYVIAYAEVIPPKNGKGSGVVVYLPFTSMNNPNG